MLPTAVSFPKKIDLDWPTLHNEFALSVIQIYDFMSQQVKGPCVSLSQFSQTAASICDCLIKRCDDFFKTMNNIFLAYRLYYNLAKSSKATVFNLQSFSFETLLKHVNDAQEQTINGKKIFISDKKVAVNVETSVIRDYVFSIIEKLKTDFTCFKHTAEVAHFDAICLTA